MKKLLFATLCLTCLATTGMYAQKGADAKGSTSTGTTSSEREAKNQGKGTPILQKTSSGDATTPAGMAPGSTAPAAAPATDPADGNSGNGGATISPSGTSAPASTSPKAVEPAKAPASSKRGGKPAASTSASAPKMVE